MYLEGVKFLNYFLDQIKGSKSQMVKISFFDFPEAQAIPIKIKTDTRVEQDAICYMHWLNCYDIHYSIQRIIHTKNGQNQLLKGFDLTYSQIAMVKSITYLKSCGKSRVTKVIKKKKLLYVKLHDLMIFLYSDNLCSDHLPACCSKI